jgi:hypothetical protein
MLEGIWGSMASSKQRVAARRNIKKAAAAAKRKRTVANLPKRTRTALGKEGEGGQAETQIRDVALRHLVWDVGCISIDGSATAVKWGLGYSEWIRLRTIPCHATWAGSEDQDEHDRF